MTETYNQKHVNSRANGERALALSEAAAAVTRETSSLSLRPRPPGEEGVHARTGTERVRECLLIRVVSIPLDRSEAT